MMGPSGMVRIEFHFDPLFGTCVFAKAVPGGDVS